MMVLSKAVGHSVSVRKSIELQDGVGRPPWCLTLDAAKEDRLAAGCGSPKGIKNSGRLG